MSFLLKDPLELHEVEGLLRIPRDIEESRVCDNTPYLLPQTRLQFSREGDKQIYCGGRRLANFNETLMACCSIRVPPISAAYLLVTVNTNTILGVSTL